MDEYEEVLASKRAIRVLSIVAEYGELTITELVRKAGIDHVVADEIVRQLAGFGLLLDEYHEINRIIKSNFRRYNILFIKNQGVKIELAQF